jgi:hypothetical protein
MQDRESALTLYDGLIEIWHGTNAATVLEQISSDIGHLNGYSPDFIF